MEWQNTPIEFVFWAYSENIIIEESGTNILVAVEKKKRHCIELS